NRLQVVIFVDFDAGVDEYQRRLPRGTHPCPNHDLGRVCGPVNDSSLLVGFLGIPCDHSDVLSVELLLDGEELLIRKDDRMVALVARPKQKLSALLDSRLLIRGAEDSSLPSTDDECRTASELMPAQDDGCRTASEPTAKGG
ncbi:hypothetical protein COOONC_11735, partial [Cooperia oncophora]